MRWVNVFFTCWMTNLFVVGILLFASSLSKAGAMTNIYVSTQSELMSAISSAESGDSIILKDGAYGSLALKGVSFSDYVTITSETPLGATFKEIDVQDSSYIRIDGVHVDSPSNGSSGSRLVSVTAESHHIHFVNSEVNGKVDGNYVGHIGIFAQHASDVLFENNYIHDVKIGAAFFGVDDLDLSGNTVNYIGSDTFKFTNIHRALIENNIGATHVYPAEGAHLDFMQFQPNGSEVSSSDIVIRGNVLLPGTAANIQGIFMATVEYNNVLIEQNIIYTGMITGIRVADGENVVIRDNTLLDIAGQVHNGTKILAPTATTYGNIETGLTSKTGEVGGDLVLQNVDPSKPFYYDDYLVNANVGRWVTLGDLQTVTNSIAEGYGAQNRLNELLSGEGSNTSPSGTSNNIENDLEPSPSTDGAEAPTQGDTANSGTNDISGYRIDLVDTDTGEVVAEINDGTILDKSLIGRTDLSIAVYSETGIKIGSAVLDFHDGAIVKTENVTPYALFGDGKKGFSDSDGLALFDKEGDYSIDVSLYDGRNGSGSLIEALNVSISVSTPPTTETEPQTPTNPGPAIEGDTDLDVWLVDTQTGEFIYQVENGSLVDSDLVDGRSVSLAVYAETGGTYAGKIGSAALDFDAGTYSRVENSSPYVLFGDSAGKFKSGVDFDDGFHQMTIDLYSDSRAGGLLLGQEIYGFEIA